jgi:predicted metal-dependent hydrolase
MVLAMPSAKSGVRRAPTKIRKSRELFINGEVIEVKVREGARSKQMRLGVGVRGVSLSVPRRTSEKVIDSFLSENKGWLSKTLLRQSSPSSNKLGLLKSGVVWREGEAIPLLRTSGARSRAYLARYKEEKVLAVGGPREKAAEAIENWCREELRLIAGEMISKEEPLMGVKVKKLRIADQKTRWGSASSNGTISLNWRLILAPRDVIDYLVIHELAHLLEMNHSKRFWAHVERRRPDWKLQKQWLQEHGEELHRWSPTKALERE